jgi:aldose 1-epimerase
MSIHKELWGHAEDGAQILKYTLRNSSGAKVCLGSVGAGITSVIVPDKDGKMDDVVIGYKDPLSYFHDGPCAGKCPGRYANRIALGKFTLDGVTYDKLPINNGPNHLHGGPDGFANRVWDSRTEDDSVIFSIFSKDGDAGYPGNVRAEVHYTWNDDNELRIDFYATSDKPTVINLTNHSYFNLNGEGSGTVKNQILYLNASKWLPTDKDLIPTGELQDVKGTPMDFTQDKKIGKDLDADFPALKYGKGYDNCFCIDNYSKGEIQFAARLYSPKTSRVMKVYTTQPGLQVYTGNWLNGCPEGKNGHVYHDYDAVALECQHFPDSPNEPAFPSTVLRPGETYTETIIFAFSTR